MPISPCSIAPGWPFKTYSSLPKSNVHSATAEDTPLQDGRPQIRRLSLANVSFWVSSQCPQLALNDLAVGESLATNQMRLALRRSRQDHLCRPHRSAARYFLSCRALPCCRRAMRLPSRSKAVTAVRPRGPHSAAASDAPTFSEIQRTGNRRDAPRVAGSPSHHDYLTPAAPAGGAFFVFPRFCLLTGLVAPRGPRVRHRMMHRR